MKRLKQIAAIIMIIIILGLFFTTVVLALLGEKYADYFRTSLVATVMVPVFTYIIFWLRKVLKDRV